MAKKIVINFTANPIPGTLISPSKGINYQIFVNGTVLPYNSGLEWVNIEFVPYGTVGYNPQYIIEVQPALAQTIQAVIAFLNSRCVHPNIVYSIVGNTIEVLFNVSDYTVVNFGVSNVNIIQTAFTVADDELLNLRYFFQYKNIVGDEYICRMYKKQYTGESLEIHGTATIEKSPAKDHLDPIRGTGLSLELEANLNLTLEDLYTENEQDFMVKLYKNNKLIFRGFLNPEGVFQSFTRDSWIITLDVVDGLGALNNLSFVDPTGFPFTGKMKAIDIVYYCLLRSGIALPINVSINTFYDGLAIDETTEILNKISLNSDRFQKIDNDTIMSCDEVLRSVLDLFSACITQEDGEWYIYKPNELFNIQNVVFKKYNIDNIYVANITLKTQKQLGSHIDNFYPHHCGGDQNIQIKGSVSAFRINYKYGFVNGLLQNKRFIHTGLSYDGWTINPTYSYFIITDPTDNKGLKMHPLLDASTVKLIASSNSVPLLIDDVISFNLTTKANGSAFFYFQVKLGSYYMKQDGSWTNTETYILTDTAWNDPSSGGSIIKVYNFTSAPIPVNGNISVNIYSPRQGIFGSSPNNATVTEIYSLDIVPVQPATNEVGEFHTVQRQIRTSSNVKETKSIFNGDNAGLIYLGAIFKEDGVTPTTTWSRKGNFESFPVLRIAAEEELRISQKPLKIFKGSAYGQLPFLSVVEIIGVNDKFMAIEYSYDTMTNIMRCKYLELFSAEITDILYKFTYDYGSVVKPTITS